MACDGELHDKELAEIKSIAEGSIYFDGMDYEKEIGSLIDNFKSHGITSVTNFYKTLETTEFENTEEQHLLEVLIRIVEADDRVDENEVKFISKVRAKTFKCRCGKSPKVQPTVILVVMIILRLLSMTLQEPIPTRMWKLICSKAWRRYEMHGS